MRFGTGHRRNSEFEGAVSHLANATRWTDHIPWRVYYMIRGRYDLAILLSLEKTKPSPCGDCYSTPFLFLFGKTQVTDLGHDVPRLSQGVGRTTRNSISRGFALMENLIREGTT